MPPSPTKIEISGEPCQNPDWDPAQETVMEFANRMRRERGWCFGHYDLPYPSKGGWPMLRVDEDSVLWMEWSRLCVYVCIGHRARDPHVRLAYCAPAAAHLDLLDQLELEGYLAGPEVEQIRRALRDFLSTNSRKALDRARRAP